MPRSVWGFEQTAKEEGEGEKKTRRLMAQQEAKLPGHPPRTPRAVYLLSPKQAWRMFPAALDASRINVAPIFGSHGKGQGAVVPSDGTKAAAPHCTHAPRKGSAFP